MNATPKIDKFSKQCIFLGGIQKLVVDALFKFPKLTRTWWGLTRLPRALKPMARRKLGRVALHHKGA
jgi:hypothetical protein